MTREATERLHELAEGREVSDFRARMLLQAEVIRVIAHEFYEDDELEATVEVAPVFARIHP